jgi:ribonuclease J
MIQIKAIGGFSEVGRNMTAVKYKDEVLLLDMGLHLENYINYKGDDDIELFTKELILAEAVPDDRVIENWRDKVIAIIPSHGHLDHIGAIPYMANRYKAPIICSAYTASVIKAILKDKDMKIPNEIISLKGRIALSDSITVEFINITHSILDTALVVIHTPDGQIVYSLDFKLDDTPTLGKKPDYEAMKKLRNVKALILDSLYADTPGKCPSESEAKEKLGKVLLEEDNRDKAIIVTTFSSHIARLKSIVEFGKKMNRKIVFCGRSLAKYVYAAEDIVNFSKSVEIISYRKKVKKRLQEIEKEGRDKYLIVTTGHQGEPNAVLSRIADGRLGFNLLPGDHVVFSCTVIPNAINIENRQKLESKLLERNVKIFRNIHASGHAFNEDHKKLIEILNPKHIIPAHCGIEKAQIMAEFIKNLGYTAEVINNGDTLEV